MEHDNHLRYYQSLQALATSTSTPRAEDCAKTTKVGGSKSPLT